MQQLKLDLSAKVFAFPRSRHLAYVRRIAATLMENDEDDAQRYWQVVVDGIALPLLAAGMPRAEVEAEVWNFHHAVQREIWLAEAREGGAG
jgi:hypothetical protein